MPDNELIAIVARRCRYANDGCEMPELNLTRVSGDDYCENCYEIALSDGNIFYCERCEETLNSTHYGHNGYCIDCAEPWEDNEIPEQPIVDITAIFQTQKTPAKILSRRNGAILKTLRPFGIELELLHGEGRSTEPPPKWKSVSDGSIRGNGFELNSPILSGLRAENEISKITAILRKQGCSFNGSCSYHLHLSAHDFVAKDAPTESEAQKKLDGFIANEIQKFREKLSGENYHGEMLSHYAVFLRDNAITSEHNDILVKVRKEKHTATKNLYPKLKALMLAYIVADDAVRAMIPLSRRTSSYCMPFAERYHLHEIEIAGSYAQLESIWYRQADEARRNSRKSGKYDDSRRCGVNLHALFYRTNAHPAPTIEIRYHSPTLNATKILQWASLHLSLADFAAKQTNATLGDTAQKLQELNKILPLEKKADALFSLFAVPDATIRYAKKRMTHFAKQEEEEKELCAE